MTTLPLRELMRHPTAIKKLTAKGQSVRITDNGKPLWVLTPDSGTQELKDEEEMARQEWTEKYLDEHLAEVPKKGTSLARQVIDSRGKY